MKKRRTLPRAWTEAMIRPVLDYYDSQTDDERFADIEAARKAYLVLSKSGKSPTQRRQGAEKARQSHRQ